MWGSDNWGELVWSGGVVAPVPLLEPTALIVLAVALTIGTLVVARRASATR
jgi:hypothetical protein